MKLILDFLFFFIYWIFIVGTAHQRCIMVAHLQNNYILDGWRRVVVKSHPWVDIMEISQWWYWYTGLKESDTTRDTGLYFTET
jgi:hypothetical protein